MRLPRHASAAVLLFLGQHLHAQWTRTNGPEGITVTDLFDDGTTLFAGTSAHGVYKSADHGASWSAVNAGIETRDVLCVHGDGTYLYIGTVAQGMFRSADNGTTWTPCGAGLGNASVQCLLDAAGYLWAGTIGMGVFRSSDHGASWQEANGGGFLATSFMHGMAYHAPRLLAASDNGLYWTEDLGVTWEQDQGSPAGFTIDRFFVEGDLVVASAGGTVFRSTDGGVDWDDAIFVDPDIHIVGLARAGDALYAGHARGFWRSDDDGATWSPVESSGLRSGPHNATDFLFSGTQAVLGFEELGTYSSADQGTTWAPSIDGFEPACTIDNALLFSNGTLYTGTHGDGVHASTDEGASWQRVGAPPPLDTLANAHVSTLLRPSAQVMLAGTCGNGLYRSADGGGTWLHITAGLATQPGTGFSCINGLAGSGNALAASTDRGIYYSNDGGLTWHATVYAGIGKRGMCIAGNGSVMCASILVSGVGNVYRSTDAGVSWSSVSNIADAVAMTQDGVGHFYLGTFTDNYRSDDGSSWFPVGPGIAEGSGGYSLLARDEHVFIGNATGVYHSDDQGDSFTNVSDGMQPAPDRAVQGLAMSGTHVFAGLFRNAVWSRPLSDFGIATGLTERTTNDVALHVFPNPAADEAQLVLDTPLQRSGIVQVCDLQGRTVQQVVLNAGLDRMWLDLHDFAAGTYLVRIMGGTRAPVVLLKR